MKQWPHERLATMKTAHEATGTEPTWEIARFMQKPMGSLKASAKLEGGDQRGGENFRVGDLTLWIFTMTECFQQIVTKAVYEYNLCVHRGSSPVVVQ
nr:hypothetical protein [Rhabdochromatium marinum]